MKNETNSYKETIKSTTIVGGTQIIQMLVIIIRSKIVAILLGSAGMGIYSIFQSMCTSIGQISSLGIQQSAVRERAQMKAKGTLTQIEKSLEVFNTLVYFVSFLGFIICLLGSPIISKWMFGDYGYTSWFMLLSFAIFFFGLSQGRTTIMQGFRELVILSKTSLYSSIISLLIAVLLYYSMGISGIIPSIILGYIISYIIGYLYLKKASLNYHKVSLNSFIKNVQKGMPIIKLGIVLMISSSILTISTLVINAVINNYGTLNDVGYNQASFNIINQAILVIMAVLASDYYPRLSGVIYNKPSDVQIIVNQQLELTILIIAPVSMFLIIFAPFIIKLLLTKEFLVIEPVIKYMSVAMIFRCIWSIMSYIILAKGDKRIFLLFDGIIGNGSVLFLNIISYINWGLVGIGISYTLCSIVCSVLIIILVRVKYNIRIKYINIVYAIGYLAITSILLFLCSFSNNKISLFVCIIILCIVFLFSFFILNKRVGLLSIIKNKFSQWH